MNANEICNEIEETVDQFRREKNEIIEKCIPILDDMGFLEFKDTKQSNLFYFDIGAKESLKVSFSSISQESEVSMSFELGYFYIKNTLSELNSEDEIRRIIELNLRKFICKDKKLDFKEFCNRKGYDYSDEEMEINIEIDMSKACRREYKKATCESFPNGGTIWS